MLCELCADAGDRPDHDEGRAATREETNQEDNDNGNGNNNDDGGKETTADDTHQNNELDERKTNFTEAIYPGETIQPKDNVEVVSTTEQRNNCEATETVAHRSERDASQDKRTSQTTETRSGEDESRCQGWAWSTSRRNFFSVTILVLLLRFACLTIRTVLYSIRLLATKTQQGDIITFRREFEIIATTFQPAKDVSTEMYSH